MNAEEGDKCCDITQESVLINGDRAGRLSTHRIPEMTERPPKKERQNRASPSATLAGVKWHHFHSEILAPTSPAPPPPREPVHVGL